MAHTIFCAIRFEHISANPLSPVVRSVAYRTWESEVVGSIPGSDIFFPRIDDSHCDMVHSSPTAIHFFVNDYIGKQPVARKEYCAEYWLKELQEKRMGICIGRRNIPEIVRSINKAPSHGSFVLKKKTGLIELLRLWIRTQARLKLPKRENIETKTGSNVQLDLDPCHPSMPFFPMVLIKK